MQSQALEDKDITVIDRADLLADTVFDELTTSCKTSEALGGLAAFRAKMENKHAGTGVVVRGKGSGRGKRGISDAAGGKKAWFEGFAGKKK